MTLPEFLACFFGGLISGFIFDWMRGRKKADFHDWTGSNFPNNKRK